MPREVITRAVAAKGGLAQLQAVKTVKTRATSVGVPTRITIAYPDRYLVEYLDARGARTRALMLTGEKALEQDASGKIGPLDHGTRAELETGTRVSAIPLLLAAAAKDADLTWLGAVEVEGDPADAIRLRTSDGLEVTLFVARGTSDLVAIRYGSPPGETTVFESDFKQVGPLRIAHKSRITNGGSVFEASVGSVELNPVLAPGTFDLGRP